MCRYAAVFGCMGLIVLLSLFVGADPPPASSVPVEPGAGASPAQVAAGDPCHIPESLTEPHFLDPQAQALEQKLRQSTTLNVQNVALRDALAALEQMSGVAMTLDEITLGEEGINLGEVLSRKVTISVQNVRLKDALRRLLKPASLGAIGRDDVILITNRTRSDEALDIRAHPIADLVTYRGAGEVGVVQAELAKLIMSTIEPDSWHHLGGTGSISYNALTMSLIIRQTDLVHDQIESLFLALRGERCRSAELLKAAGGTTVAEVREAEISLDAANRELLRLETRVQELSQVDLHAATVAGSGTVCFPAEGALRAGGFRTTQPSLRELAADSRKAALRSLCLAIQFENEIRARGEQP